MARYREENAVDGKWTRWVQPTQGYKMACCDCGLVHNIEWEVLKVTDTAPDGKMFNADALPWGEYRVNMRVSRNERATAAKRRKRRASNAN